MIVARRSDGELQDPIARSARLPDLVMDFPANAKNLMEQNNDI